MSTAIGVSRPPIWHTPLAVILTACLIAMVGFGIRSIFGLFLEPMTVARGWDRETFALAMAIQNLLWGVGLPLAGALADRYGPRWVLAGGALIYAAGVWGMAAAESSFALHFFGGLLTGLGVAFTAFSLALAAMAKVVGLGRRSLALGLGTAAGTDAQAEVSVKLEEEGKTVTGRGADTDTMVASARAYVSALNKLLVKREKTAPEKMLAS